MLLLATCDKTGTLFPIVRARLRQGSMPHVPLRMSEVLRQALKDTRSVTRVIPYSEWVSRLGDLYTGDPSSSLQIVASDEKTLGDDDDEDENVDGQMALSKH
eukprot:6486538-Amphidinium_carterae.1